MIKDYCDGYFIWASESINEKCLNDEAFLIGYSDNLYGAFNQVIEEAKRNKEIDVSHLAYTICQSPF